MIVQLDREGADEALPNEIKMTLEPVKEKCQLITYQLILLLNKQNLAQFMEKKKQLKQLLQNMIQMLIQDSMEFLPPYTHFGQTKKLKVFSRFMQSLQELFMQREEKKFVISRKEIFRPIMCSLWLM